MAALKTGTMDSDHPAVVAAAQSHALAKLLKKRDPDLIVATDDMDAAKDTVADALKELDSAVDITTDRLAKAEAIVIRAAKAAVALSKNPGDLDPAAFEVLPPNWIEAIGGQELTTVTDDPFCPDMAAIKTTVKVVSGHGTEDEKQLITKRMGKLLKRKGLPISFRPPPVLETVH